MKVVASRERTIGQHQQPDSVHFIQVLPATGPSPQRRSINGLIGWYWTKRLQDAPRLGSIGQSKQTALPFQDPEHRQKAQIGVDFGGLQIQGLNIQRFPSQQPTCDAKLSQSTQHVSRQPQRRRCGDRRRSKHLLHDPATLKHVVPVRFIEPIQLPAQLFQRVPGLNAPTQQLGNPVAKGIVSRFRQKRVARRTHPRFMAQHLCQCSRKRSSCNRLQVKGGGGHTGI